MEEVFCAPARSIVDSERDSKTPMDVSDLVNVCTVAQMGIESRDERFPSQGVSRRDHEGCARATRNGLTASGERAGGGFLSAEGSNDPFRVCSHGPSGRTILQRTRCRPCAALCSTVLEHSSTDSSPSVAPGPPTSGIDETTLS